MRRKKPLLALAGIAALTLFAAACGAPPGPGGWAGPLPVKVDSQKLILVAHKSNLYALRDDSSVARWQFPPQDKNSYPISAEGIDQLKSAVDAFTIDDAAKTDLKKKVDGLTVTGPAADSLKTALDASGATDQQKSDMKALVDSIVTFDKKALSNLKAIYGDIGVSPDGTTTYVPTFRGMLFALDTSTGYVRWVRDAGAEIVGGVAVDGDRIYVGTKGNRLYAIDGATGERQWEFKTKGEVWATPAIDDDTIFVTSLDGSLYSLDKSGTQKWIFSAASSGIAAKPVVAGDAVYVGSFDNKLYSVKKSDGTMNWSIKADNWFWATPVVQDGIVYAASLDGKVYAVDAATGAKKWESPFDTSSAVRSSPVIAGGGLVVAAKNGRLFKLDLTTGRSVDDSAPVQLAGQTVLSNLATNGDKTVYIVPSSGTLYVLDATGALSAPGSFPLPQ